MRPGIKLLLKTIVSAGLVVLLLRMIPMQEIGEALEQVNYALFALAGILFVLHQVFVAWCWQILLVAQDNGVRFWRVLQIHFIGNFLGVFMPTSLGMDIVRAYSLSRETGRGVDAATSLFVSRIVGYLIFFAMALLVALPVARQMDNNLVFWLVLLTTACFAAGVWLLMHPGLLRRLEPLFNRLHLGRFLEKMYAFQRGSKSLRHHRRAMISLFIWSAIYQLVGILIPFLVGVSLGIHVGFHYYFIAIPVIMAVTIIPLSIGGIGIREWAFVAMFVPMGAAEAEALSLSLLLFALSIGVALIGGVVYWTSGLGKRRRKTGGEEAKKNREADRIRV